MPVCDICIIIMESQKGLGWKGLVGLRDHPTTEGFLWKFGVRIFMGTKLEYFQQKADLKKLFAELLFGIKDAFKSETVWGKKGSK